MVHILDGLFVLLLVILFAVFVDNGDNDYIVLSVVRYNFCIVLYSVLLRFCVLKLDTKESVFACKCT